MLDSRSIDCVLTAQDISVDTHAVLGVQCSFRLGAFTSLTDLTRENENESIETELKLNYRSPSNFKAQNIIPVA